VGAGSPLGVQEHVRPEPNCPARTYQIVGVVPDTKYSDLPESRQVQVYVPIAQLPLPAQGPGMAMLIAFHDSVGVQLAVRHVLEEKHPDIQMQYVHMVWSWNMMPRAFRNCKQV